MRRVKERPRESRKKWRMCEKKERFKTRWDAQKRAKRLGFRAYECPYCKGWHLTNDNKDGSP